MVSQLQETESRILTRQNRVSPEEFTELMVSRRPLVRLDDPENMLRGLVDQSGQWFVVLESELTHLTLPRD